MFLTKNKDIDLKILQKLSDINLKSICLVSKYGKKLYDDENFWLNRLLITLDIEEIQDFKNNFSYKELYYFIRNKSKSKTGILEAIKRDNIHLFRKLWTHHYYKHWGGILHEISKVGNKDMATYIISNENDAEHKYDIAGTMMETANSKFTKWLLKTGIVAYDQYIFFIYETPEKYSYPLREISKYLSRIKDSDYLNIIYMIAVYTSQNLDFTRKILEILIKFNHKSLSKDTLKKHFLDNHKSCEIEKNFIDNL